MNDTDKARIFKYMEWLFAYQNGEFLMEYPHCHLDGNDMVSAMNKIVECEEWDNFYAFASNALCEADPEDIFALTPWLMQPERFFDLMAQWLEEKK